MLSALKVKRKENADYVTIGLNTKEFGVVNEETGEYISMGSDGPVR